MPSATLECPACGFAARRELADVTACRGFKETPTESALCPRGHGPMYRNDRLRVWQGKMDLEFAMKDAWEKAQELIRAQGGDPEKILADAARNIEAWREYARKGGILPDEMGADEV